MQTIQHETKARLHTISDAPHHAVSIKHTGFDVSPQPKQLDGYEKYFYNYVHSIKRTIKRGTL
jgi:hypothetical protein